MRASAGCFGLESSPQEGDLLVVSLAPSAMIGLRGKSALCNLSESPHQKSRCWRLPENRGEQLSAVVYEPSCPAHILSAVFITQLGQTDADPRLSTQFHQVSTLGLDPIPTASP